MQLQYYRYIFSADETETLEPVKTRLVGFFSFDAVISVFFFSLFFYVTLPMYVHDVCTDNSVLLFPPRKHVNLSKFP